MPQPPSAPDSPVVVMIAAGSRAQADAIARLLVEQRLAACVQALPVTSTYRWDGAVTASEEILLLAKTRRTRFAPLEEAVRSVHDYAVPEIVCVPIESGHRPYLDWLAAETAPL